MKAPINKTDITTARGESGTAVASPKAKDSEMPVITSARSVAVGRSMASIINNV